MRAQPPHMTAEDGMPRPVRSWRLLLLVLLVLLPLTVALASPEPAQLQAGSAGQHDASVQTHGPSDTPVCHHVAHHGKASALVSDHRDAEWPEPGDTVSAVPSQGPTHDRWAVADGLLHTASSDAHRPALPIYLRTQRLRL